MLNSFLFIGAVLIFLFAVVLIYRCFGKMGIYTYIAFATILANIQATKSVEIFGLTTTAGSVLYASTFLSTDILSENYGKKEATKAVLLGIVITLLWMLGTQITIWFVPSNIDTIHESLKVVFEAVPRICIASLIAYICSQSVDVVLYHAIWKRTGNGRSGLWIRNNGSTLTSQLVDTVIFVTIAFVNTMPLPLFFEVMGTTYLFKAIVALMDTPFAYLARKIKPIKKEEIECLEKVKI